jgi:hypothetical protein
MIVWINIIAGIIDDKSMTKRVCLWQTILDLWRIKIGMMGMLRMRKEWMCINNMKTMTMMKMKMAQTSTGIISNNCRAKQVELSTKENITTSKARMINLGRLTCIHLLSEKTLRFLERTRK